MRKNFKKSRIASQERPYALDKNNNDPPPSKSQIQLLNFRLCFFFMNTGCNRRQCSNINRPAILFKALNATDTQQKQVRKQRQEQHSSSHALLGFIAVAVHKMLSAVPRQPITIVMGVQEFPAAGNAGKAGWFTSRLDIT